MLKKNEKKFVTKLLAETIPVNQAARILSQASEDLSKSNAGQVYLRLEIRELSPLPKSSGSQPSQ